MVFTEPSPWVSGVPGSPVAGGAALPGEQPRRAGACSQLRAPASQKDFLQATSINDPLNFYLSSLAGKPVIV